MSGKFQVQILQFGATAINNGKDQMIEWELHISTWYQDLWHGYFLEFPFNGNYLTFASDSMSLELGGSVEYGYVFDMSLFNFDSSHHAKPAMRMR